MIKCMIWEYYIETVKYYAEYKAPVIEMYTS